MKIDPVSSKRLSILRFPMIVGVVFIHAYGTNATFEGNLSGVQQINGFAQFVQDIISQGFARLAVPLFFMLSGYFFFLRVDWSLITYKNLIFKRFRTLLIPFIFWNTLILILYWIIQKIPATQTLLSGKKNIISSYGFFDYLNAIFGISGSPISYQFWFIRDLIILSVISPLIYLLIKHVNYLYIILLLIFWFANIFPVNIPSCASVLFFSIGATFSIYQYSLFKFDKHGKIITYIYLLSLFITTMSSGLFYIDFFKKLIILFGIISSLYLSRVIQNNKIFSKLLLDLSCYSFFVFAFHEPLLTLIKKIAYKFTAPESSIFVTFVYLICPVATIIISIFAYKFLKKISPKFAGLITGGR